MKSMKEMQNEVDVHWTIQSWLFSPLANLARLTEEVGELAKR